MKSSGTGMASWTDQIGRLGVCALIGLGLAGCASDHTAVLFSRYLYETSFATDRAAYDRARVGSVPYASIGLGIGDSRKQLIVLESVTGRDHRWLTGDPVAIVTRGGRIMNTAGFPDDLSATRLPGPDPADGGLHRLTGPVTATRIIDLRADRVFDQRVDCRLKPAGRETVTILGVDRDLIRVKERCKAKRIHWRFTNVFWADPETGRLWRSRQHVHPRMPPLTIDVLRPSSVP